MFRRLLVQRNFSFDRILAVLGSHFSAVYMTYLCVLLISSNRYLQRDIPRTKFIFDFHIWVEFYK